MNECIVSFLTRRGFVVVIRILFIIAIIYSIFLNFLLKYNVNVITIVKNQWNYEGASSFLRMNNNSNDDDDNGDEEGEELKKTSKDNYSINAWRMERNTGKHVSSWFKRKKKNSMKEAVDSNGPILDFVVAGFPKCGTTALVRQLMHITPYPGGDSCYIHPKFAVRMSYGIWTDEFIFNSHIYNNIKKMANMTRMQVFKKRINKRRERNETVQKRSSGNNDHVESMKKKMILRGYKCPAVLDMIEHLRKLGNFFPKTKLIVGIRHPVLWFQSFYNMQMENMPRIYFDPSKFDTLHPQKELTYIGCPTKHIICVARAEFHIALARMRKTPLRPNSDEMKLLQSVQIQKLHEMNKISSAGSTIAGKTPVTADNSSSNKSISDNNHDNDYYHKEDEEDYPFIPNSILLYEFSQPTNEYFYDELSQYLEVTKSQLLPNGTASIGFQTSSARTKRFKGFDICNPERDPLRQLLLPISYNIYQWLIQYFVPASQTRKDIVIPKIDDFIDLIRPYKEDPCSRLVRNATDGSFYLDPSIIV